MYMSPSHFIQNRWPLHYESSNGVYVQVNGRIFSVEASDQVEVGELAMGLLPREELQTREGDVVEVEPYMPCTGAELSHCVAVLAPFRGTRVPVEEVVRYQ